MNLIANCRSISMAASPVSLLLNQAFVHHLMPLRSGYTLTSLGMSKLWMSISSSARGSMSPLLATASS